MGTCTEILSNIYTVLSQFLDTNLDSLAKDATLSITNTKIDTTNINTNGVYDETRLHNDIIDSMKSITVASTDTPGTYYYITDIAAPTTLKRIYNVMVENPSTETDMVGKVYIKQTFGSDVRYCALTDTFIIPKSPDNMNPDGSHVSCISRLIHGAMGGEGLVVSLQKSSSTTVNFNSRVIVREAD